MSTGGCASLTVRTQPPGAKVTLDGEYIGTSPVTKPVSRGDVAPIAYLIEKEGYQQETGIAEPRTRPGAVVGAVFTAGLSMIFAGARYYEDLVVELTPETNPPGAAISDPATKLRQIQDLRDKGLISEQEYQRVRSQVLDNIR